MSATSSDAVVGRGTIHVNDEAREIDGPTSLAMIVAELGLAERKGVAVAVNGTVVTRSTWPSRLLNPGDRILVIRATQGG